MFGGAFGFCSMFIFLVKFFFPPCDGDDPIRTHVVFSLPWFDSLFFRHDGPSDRVSSRWCGGGGSRGEGTGAGGERGGD